MKLLKIYSKYKSRLSDFIIFNKWPISRQFIKFCLIGVSNVAIDTAIYWVLTRFFGFYYLLAAIISFVLANLWSYYLNRRWTFHDHNPSWLRQYFKFLATNILAAFISIGLLFVLVDFFAFYDLLAKILVSLLVAVLNFILIRAWAFKIR